MAPSKQKTNRVEFHFLSLSLSLFLPFLNRVGLSISFWLRPLRFAVEPPDLQGSSTASAQVVILSNENPVESIQTQKINAYIR